jgi:hypothetical protein
MGLSGTFKTSKSATNTAAGVKKEIKSTKNLIKYESREDMYLSNP